MQLTAHQLDALNSATIGTVGLLTGGPGSGKTTCLGHLIRQLRQRNGSSGMAGAAPTGKAARRMTEALGEQGIRLLHHDTPAARLHVPGGCRILRL